MKGSRKTAFAAAAALRHRAAANEQASTSTSMTVSARLVRHLLAQSGGAMASSIGATAFHRSHPTLLLSHRTYSALATAAAQPQIASAWWRKIAQLHRTAGFREALSINGVRLNILKSWRTLRWEASAAAINNGLTISDQGHRLLGAVVPLALLARLFPNRFTALADSATPFMMPTKAQLDACDAAEYKKAWLPRFLTSSSVYEEALVWVRGAYLTLLFMPVLLSAPFVFGLNIGRAQWMALICWTLEKSGAAFIKWGQWASTRPDMFPPDLCTSLEKLQTNAPQHSTEATITAVESAFGRPISDLFDSFEIEPVASGSIAQIHRGRLSAMGAAACGAKRGATVAVKVRHPGVTQLMHRDFILMQRAANLASHVPWIADLRLDESIRQFGGPLKEQLDLTLEAQNLKRFNHNFRRWRNVSFPTPMHPLVAPAVLVESFEEGALINGYIKRPGYKYNGIIAETGLKLYLQMLLQDNFIHADLHPGNVLVKEIDTSSLKGVARMVSSWFGNRPNVILLDTGMVAELSPVDQANLVSFFRALTMQDGANVARSILSMSESKTCKDPAAFVDALESFFSGLSAEYISKYTADVFQEMIETLRQHQVTLKSTVSTVVVTTLVLEGWSNQLDPNLHILDHMRSLLHAQSWADRLSSTVDTHIAMGAVAV